MSTNIKTWQERAGKAPDCKPQPYAYGWYWQHALAEIAELRAAMAATQAPSAPPPACAVCKGSGEQRGPRGFPCVTCDGTGEVLDAPADDIKSSDITHCLREYARNSGYSHNDYADAMRIAADEIDRLTATQKPDSGRDAVLTKCRQLLGFIATPGSVYADFADALTALIFQPAAHPAPSSDAALSKEAKECLMDVVSHHGDFHMACNVTRDLHLRENDKDSASYWEKQKDVLSRMKVQAEAALAASKKGSS